MSMQPEDPNTPPPPDAPETDKPLPDGQTPLLPPQSPAHPAPGSLARRWGPPWLEPLLLLALACGGGALCLMFTDGLKSGDDPVSAMFGAAIALLTFAVAGCRLLRPRWAILPLLAVSLGSAASHAPQYATLWMFSSAAAGCLMALILRLPWQEADLFLWPPLALGGLFTLLGGAAQRFTLGPLIADAMRWLDAQTAMFKAMLPAQFPMQYASWSLASANLILFCLILWGSSRVARRIIGPWVCHPRSSLIFFHLRPRHILPLIVALVLAILNGLTGRLEPLAWALPLFVAVGTAGVIAGFGVFLFHAAFWRAQGLRWQAYGLVGLLALGLVFTGPLLVGFLALLGLADTWLDFRKLRKIAGPLGHPRWHAKK